ncbi:MAG TPA: hypothetical protein VNR18_12265 [Hyphomicrobiales bacterium]|nr:hypothetical protein [Hyphomicrobiales bacterium]
MSTREIFDKSAHVNPFTLLPGLVPAEARHTDFAMEAKGPAKRASGFMNRRGKPADPAMGASSQTASVRSGLVQE